MKIGVVLPTYRDPNGKWDRIFKRFIDSLDNIENVNNLEFLVNYQNPYKLSDNNLLDYLESRIRELNSTWSLKIKSNTYDKISMVVIRNDCMKMNMDCDFYLFIDDDMKFNKGAGDCYNEMINFFKEDEELGMIMSAGFLGGYNYKHKLKYAISKHWYVCRGLMIRNLHISEDSPLYSKDILDLHEGGYEEMPIAMEVTSLGLKMATHFNNPTTHKIVMTDKNNGKEARYSDDNIHKVDIAFDSISKFIKSRYNIDYEIKSNKDFQVVLNMINKNRNS